MIYVVGFSCLSIGMFAGMILAAILRMNGNDE